MRICSMEKNKANQYVVDLFETFSIEKNSLLGKEWRNALIDFTDQVVTVAWKQIVAECRTRYLPPLKVVYAILFGVRKSLSKQHQQPVEIEELSYQERKEQHQYIRMIMNDMKRMRDGTLTNKQMLKEHAMFFKTVGLDADAEELLRASAQEEVV